MQAWKDYAEKHKQRFLDELLELLKIPSVSARSENKNDMIRCAEAVKNKLLQAGADHAELIPTDGHPIVFAEKIIDTYAMATQHVDQGLSLTLFFKDTATTRDVNRAQIYAWRKGIKTIYYIRIRQAALEGTEVENCVSCML